MAVFTPMTNQPQAIIQRTGLRTRRGRWFLPGFGQSNQGGSWPVFTRPTISVNRQYTAMRARRTVFAPIGWPPAPPSRNPSTRVLVPFQQISATGVSPGFSIAAGTSSLQLQLITSLVNGAAASMTVGVSWSMDGINFGAVDTSPDNFAAITAAGDVVKLVTVKAPWAQFTYTLTGTAPLFWIQISAAPFGS